MGGLNDSGAAVTEPKPGLPNNRSNLEGSEPHAGQEGWFTAVQSLRKNILESGFTPLCCLLYLLVNMGNKRQMTGPQGFRNGKHLGFFLGI